MRNSLGNSWGRLSRGLGGGGGVWESGVSVFSAGFSIGVGVNADFIQFTGVDIIFGAEKIGFLVRIINRVVVQYMGIIAIINVPNTRPGNPRRCA